MTDHSSSADVINSAFQDPVPRMPDSTDPVVTLLRGFNGDKTAIVREMTGADEEFLAAMETKSSLLYPEYVSALLKRTVVSIGDIEIKKSPDVIDELIIGDRDLLFLGVVKATYGKVKIFKITCPFCNQDSDISVNIEEDFELQGSEEAASKDIEVTLRNGKSYTFRLPTGADAKIVVKRGKTIAEQNTLMISRCVTSPVTQPMQWAKDLSIADRSTIVSAILDVKIGPKIGEVNDPCPVCSEMISVPLDWVSLLFG